MSQSKKANSQSNSVEDAAKKEPEEQFTRVLFHAKSNVNDKENVELSVNGDQIVCQRDQEIVLPERFLHCADHTTYPVFTQVPGKTRKKVGKVQTYPYTRLGPGTREEYEKMRFEGTEITREHVEKYGMGGDDEQ